MSDANVVKLLQPGSFADPLTEVLRNGARGAPSSGIARGSGTEQAGDRVGVATGAAQGSHSRVLTTDNGRFTVRRARLAPAMISTAGHRPSEGANAGLLAQGPRQAASSNTGPERKGIETVECAKNRASRGRLK